MVTWTKPQEGHDWIESTPRRFTIARITYGDEKRYSLADDVCKPVALIGVYSSADEAKAAAEAVVRSEIGEAA